MTDGTVSNLIMCGILVAGLAFAFWFTAVLPERMRREKRVQPQTAQEEGRE